MAAQKEIVWVEGYDAFKSFIDNWAKDNKGNLFVYFSGSKDLETGKSWCPDCVTAQPIVEELFNKATFDDDAVLLYVGVGPRPFWKDPSCVFRVQEPRINSVPTLVKWGVNTSKRLGDDKCGNKSLVEMFFEDDD